MPPTEQDPSAGSGPKSNYGSTERLVCEETFMVKWGCCQIFGRIGIGLCGVVALTVVALTWVAGFDLRFADPPSWANKLSLLVFVPFAFTLAMGAGLPTALSLLHADSYSATDSTSGGSLRLRLHRRWLPDLERTLPELTGILELGQGETRPIHGAGQATAYPSWCLLFGNPISDSWQFSLQRHELFLERLRDSCASVGHPLAASLGKMVKNPEVGIIPVRDGPPSPESNAGSQNEAEISV
eukprot:gnl/TRDRNA2_/TRDRNA2_181816_c0_seq1.p1 gnl/TRDRNA2_/TRDRNA2_181816_c0~~gnl/TRDRNA2_/TRDRNA2_181816_c0_seq1.p1  ORF type:complete len:241 (+),score=16.85 gnl/TRDRNA2_/TRDRNA2_181816_c0_seq1:82-804(+)